MHKIKYVIHAVGPVYSKHHSTICQINLVTAVWCCYKLAELQNIKSISIPAISSGIFGFPKDLCAKLMIMGTYYYFHQDGMKCTYNFDSIRFTNIDYPTYSIFTDEYDDILRKFKTGKVEQIDKDVLKILESAKSKTEEMLFVQNNYEKMMKLHCEYNNAHPYKNRYYEYLNEKDGLKSLEEKIPGEEKNIKVVTSSINEKDAFNSLVTESTFPENKQKDAQNTEENKEIKKKEEQKKEDIKIKDTQKEEIKVEESKDEPKKEKPIKEEQKKEEPKYDDPKKEELTKEELPKEESKKVVNQKEDDIQNKEQAGGAKDEEMSNKEKNKTEMKTESTKTPTEEENKMK